MDKNIAVEEIPHEKIGEQKIELVERKGAGHPDSLADGISESVSRALCNAYRERFGAIAHHNTDEVQIIGGKSQPQFGGGEMLQPIYILLGGRATQIYQEKGLNVHGIAKQAAQQHLQQTVRNLDIDQHIIIDSRIGQGSADLTEMYSRKQAVPLANDTSFGMGHAPLSDTEKMVLQLEKHLNSDQMKKRMPALGEDIKIMAYRDHDNIQLTVAAAFVDQYVNDLDAYISLKQELRQEILDFVPRYTDHTVDLHINTADSHDKGSVYFTVTGTSAEMGDDGSTGRGNRVSGLITPKRAMSLEASSGKNPVAHIGKIYNILSHYIADQVVAENDQIEEATVKLLSQIGQPINQPQIASIQLATADGVTPEIEQEVQEVTDYWLENIPQVMDKVISGEITTF